MKLARYFVLILSINCLVYVHAMDHGSSGTNGTDESMENFVIEELPHWKNNRKFLFSRMVFGRLKQAVEKCDYRQFFNLSKTLDTEDRLRYQQDLFAVIVQKQSQLPRERGDFELRYTAYAEMKKCIQK